MNYEEHTCALLPVSGVYISRNGSEENSKNENWSIRFYREATEEDLEDSNLLEELGEEIWALEAYIKACPYCGHQLELPDQGSTDAKVYSSFGIKNGTFRLLDQENWNIRIR